MNDSSLITLSSLSLRAAVRPRARYRMSALIFFRTHQGTHSCLNNFLQQPLLCLQPPRTRIISNTPRLATPVPFFGLPGYSWLTF